MQQEKGWRFAYFDLGRALACLLVVVYHAGGTASLPKYFGEHELSEWIAFGYVRMPFFFAMSGFLLSWLYLTPQPQRAAASAAFLAKRLGHLYPLYWVVLCCVAALQIFVLGQSGSAPKGWEWVETALLLPQDPSEVGGTGAAVLYPAWVLQYELVGYCFIALALWRPVLRRAYLLVFPALYVLLSDADTFLLSFLGSKWLLIFWMGAAAAWAARRMTDRHRRVALALAMLWLAGAAMEQYFATSPRAAGLLDLDLHYGVGFALLMIFLSGFKRSAAPQGQHPVQHAVEKLSNWSYAIFLCHAPVISLVCKMVVASGLRGAAGWAVAMMGSVALSIVLGAAMHRLVERPADRWIRRSARNVQSRWARVEVAR